MYIKTEKAIYKDNKEVLSSVDNALGRKLTFAQNKKINLRNRIKYSFIVAKTITFETKD